VSDVRSASRIATGATNPIDVHGVRALRHSTVKLASSEGFARDFLPAAVIAFREKHPGVRFG
jgi:DNA-binding transcriptional LysR family regulator